MTETTTSLSRTVTQYQQERWEEEKGMETIPSPQKNNLRQDSEGIEENRYPLPDSN
jgi:hypothetical protein